MRGLIRGGVISIFSKSEVTKNNVSYRIIPIRKLDMFNIWKNRNSFFRGERGAFETSYLFFRKKFRLCDLLLKYLNGGILYLLPNRGQTMFWTILEFCHGLNDAVQTSPPVQYNNAGLSRAPFPGKLEANHP